MRRWRITGLVALAVIALAIPVYVVIDVQRDDVATEPAVAPLTFVGRGQCADCHTDAYQEWRGSHHDDAMDHASEQTVLGDFDGAEFEHNGVTSRFFRRDGKFFVNTEGQGGEMAEFEVLYTFGVEPLQQYLVPFPGGRLQALSIAWDAGPWQASQLTSISAHWV